MPLNGSGGVTQPVGSIYPAVAQTLIESAKANVSFADIYTILASAIYKDGQQVATQRVPFAQGIQTDSVTEKTADAGVTLDGVLLKDGRIDTTQGADIVCAATINLETATGNVVDVTGSTGPVTAITLSAGHWRIVRFVSTPTLTNSGTLVLPGAADITAVAGDYALFIGYAASVVRVWYHRASGAGVITAPFSDTTAIVKGSADATKLARFEADGITTGTTRVFTLPDRDGTVATTTVDAFTTGDVKLTLKTVADTGWVLMDDKTIGNAASGGTGRANADTVGLFTLLWTNTADAECAVSTGRGASAAADYAANKTIALPKALGRALATYGSGSGLTARALAKTVGVETHPLTEAEGPAHTHTLAGGANTGGLYVTVTAPNAGTAATNTTGSSGSGTAHQNMQPTVFLNCMIKL